MTRLGSGFLLLSILFATTAVSQQRPTNATSQADVLAFGAKCDGTTDDLAAIQSAMAAGGSLTTPPRAMTRGAQVGNGAQGTVTFPGGQTCAIRGTLEVPPGLSLRGNGVQLKELASGDAVAIHWRNTGYGYGVFFNAIADLSIVGPGAQVSTGHGILLDRVSGARFDNLTISGFKIGLDAQEVQYSTFTNISAVYNVVGCYITARADAKGLTSIDNVFINSVCRNNLKYGLWNQTGSQNRFYKTDANFNGEAGVVIGQQLRPYISAAKVAKAGRCRLNASLPMIFTTAAGSRDLQPSGFVTTDAVGAVSAAYVMDGGEDDAGDAIAVFGCEVTPVLTPVITDDAGVGDWDGSSTTQRGDVLFEGLKIET
jgi:hypothetical protein